MFNPKIEELIQEREKVAIQIKVLQKRRKALSSHISVLRHRERKENVI